MWRGHVPTGRGESATGGERTFASTRAIWVGSATRFNRPRSRVLSGAIYERGDLRVERTTVVIGEETYAVRHIVALKVFPVRVPDPRPPRLRLLPILAVVGGLFCLAMAVTEFLNPPVGWAAYGWLASFMLAGCFFRNPTEERPWVVAGSELELVTSTGKRITFMTSKDDGEIERARAALQQVIALNPR